MNYATPNDILAQRDLSAFRCVSTEHTDLLSGENPETALTAERIAELLQISVLRLEVYAITKRTQTYGYNYNPPTPKPEEKPSIECPLFFYSNSWKQDATRASQDLLDRITAFRLIPSKRGGGYGYYEPWSDYECPVAIGFNFDFGMVTLVCRKEYATKTFGLVITPKMTWKIGNVELPITSWESDLREVSYYSGGSYRSGKSQGFDFTDESVSSLFGHYHYGISNDTESQRNFLQYAVANGWRPTTDPRTAGVKKSYDKIRPYLEELIDTDIMSYIAVRSIANDAGRSVDGVKVSTVFNELMSGVDSSESLRKVISEFWEKGKSIHGYQSLDNSIKALDSYKEKRKAVLKAQGNRAFTKLMQEFEFLTIDEEQYPVTTKAIKDGELPIATFFRKAEQYFLVNDNWMLWEEMLTKHKEEALELANEVKGRTTYEKDLMSYFYFVLHALPDYLQKMTGKTWTCSPKLVNSQSELEPPTEGDDGITRQRSALTPIVDNDNRTVEVPYASLCVSGSYGSTYCYSHDYHVLTKGFSHLGNAVTEDFASKLNGKDDYGLMFYTLTGSSQGRGYPTFLIIFERRSQKGDTKVHFHRTHPTRSKDGDLNPIHNWIRVCYNWMAGNVNKNNIAAQQGDLFFVRTDKPLEFKDKVNAYDKHTFEKEVDFATETDPKSNILGYVSFSTDKQLRHTEHDDVVIPAGTFAIHQCRSWEANPKGVWSLRID